MTTFCMVCLSLALFSTFSLVAAEEGDCSQEQSCRNKNEALHLKLGAIASILIGGTIGVCLPILGGSISVLRQEDFFIIIKAFAAGVILATGFVHILPAAFESLGNDCLTGATWKNLPFAGFIGMMGAVGCLMVEAKATGYYQRAHLKKQPSTVGVVDMSSAPVGYNGELKQQSGDSEHQIYLHIHGCTHAYDSTAEGSTSALLRHGVISQARFENRSTALMALFFSITTPLGIAVGMAVSSTYNENSPTALIVEGMFDAVSGGILIYMSLADLLAADFLSSQMLSKMGL